MEEVFSSILESGDKSFELEDFYDALWKYEHAIKLAKSCSSLKTREPLAVSNASHSCLRLGDAEVAGERRRVHWYYYGYRHADSALSVEPSPSVASKVWMDQCCVLYMEIVMIMKGVNLFLYTFYLGNLS